MAHLARKGDVFVARFTFGNREYKKSLKTKRLEDAKVALLVVELTLHRLLIGQLQVPAGVDPGDFVVSGGTAVAPPVIVEPPAPRLLADTVAEYLPAMASRISPNYHYSQKIHLGHVARFFGDRYPQLTLEQITPRDLNRYLEERLKTRHPNTVVRERVTLQQFFKWTVEQEYLGVSPARSLQTIKGDEDSPEFATLAEINQTIDRGGLSDAEVLRLWDRLYLRPAEIAELLQTVRSNATLDYAHLLHAIPAYTGMRRGEVLRLLWRDVNFDAKFVIAQSRKQSRSKRIIRRRIDMHPDLERILLAWKEKRPKGQNVISQPKSFEPVDSSRANSAFWQPMRGTHWCLDSRKNWYKVGFHTYRHSFASNLAAAGVDQRIIDEFMGHQTEAMRKLYRHLSPNNRRSAILELNLSSAQSTAIADSTVAQNPA